MGTKRLKGQRAAGTGPLPAESNKGGTATLKKGTGPLKPNPNVKLGRTGPIKSGMTTGQLRMPPSKRRGQRRIRPLRMLLVFGTFFGTLGLAAALAGAYMFFESLSPESAHREQRGPALNEFASGLVPMSERQNILLLGTDFSYTEGHRMQGGPVRSDTIIVASADPTTQHLNMISIPRDTRVYFRGHYDKINSAMAYGGPELVSSVVSELLGVPVTRWVQINTTSLEQLVDALGGVNLHVDKDMRYVDHTAHLDIDIRQGWQTLSGAQAHQYVRFRHDELGDIGRVQRQQQFLRAASGQMLSPMTLPKVPALLDVVRRNVATNFSGAELLRLGLWAPHLTRERVKMVMLPGEFSAGRYAVSYWLVSPETSQSLGRRLLAGGDAALSVEEAKRRLKLTVLNGTPREGVASAAAHTLREAGWNVWSVGDASDRGVRRTRLIAQTGYDQAGAALAASLHVEPELVDASVGDLLTDFTVVVGEDFVPAR